jgi:hypothetical protein
MPTRSACSRSPTEMATAELNVFGEYHRRHIRDIKHRKIYALYNSGKMTDVVVLHTMLPTAHACTTKMSARVMIRASLRS